MTFEYRELGTQILFSGDPEPPCQGATCAEQTRDDEVCDPCGTTECQETTENPCQPTFKPEEPGKDDYRQALAVLRQQLHESLSAG
jgi:hypothetical protein